MRILDPFKYLYQFSESKQAVIKWITTHKEDVLTMSTNDLALATFTSTDTIVYFCENLGFRRIMFLK